MRLMPGHSISIKDNKIFLNETDERARRELLMFFMEYKGLFLGLNRMAHNKWIFVRINDVKIRFELEYSDEPEISLYTIKVCKGCNYIFGLNSVFNIMKKKLLEMNKTCFEPDYYAFKKKYLRELQSLFGVLTGKDVIKVKLNYGGSLKKI